MAETVGERDAIAQARMEERTVATSSVYETFHIALDAQRDSLAHMKTVLRIVVGLIGLVVIFLGVKQFTKGVHEISGKGSPAAQKVGGTYTSTENGYSHRIPEGWQSKPGPQPGVTMIVAPKESGLSSNMVMSTPTKKRCKPICPTPRF
jgi:hypothetical protein